MPELSHTVMNCLLHLKRPLDFLDSIDSLLTEQGFVALFSPFSWLPEYTPSTHWLGGRGIKDEVAKWSQETLEREVSKLNKCFFVVVLLFLKHRCLEQMASRGFKLERSFNVPFIIREHRRKYQLGVSLLTIFKRAKTGD